MHHIQTYKIKTKHVSLLLIMIKSTTYKHTKYYSTSEIYIISAYKFVGSILPPSSFFHLLGTVASQFLWRKMNTHGPEQTIEKTCGTEKPVVPRRVERLVVQTDRWNYLVLSWNIQKEISEWLFLFSYYCAIVESFGYSFLVDSILLLKMEKQLFTVCVFEIPSLTWWWFSCNI